MDDLVGVHEIAEMLKVTRQRVDRIASTDSSFPDPVAVLAAGRIWRREEVEVWINQRKHRRLKPRS